MNEVFVQSTAGVTLAGAAGFSLKLLDIARQVAPKVVAADGGADRLLALGCIPDAVIGDLDSISSKAKLRLKERLFPIREQATTDFDKALRSIAAPFVVGIGFLGARLDHTLAVLNGLVAHPDRRCLLLGGRDVTFLAPRELTLRLPVGSRLSLFPMGPVQGESEGLRWPLQGLRFAPGGMTGTSNEVTEPLVRLRFDADLMLVILPRSAMARALDAFDPSGVRAG